MTCRLRAQPLSQFLHDAIQGHAPLLGGITLAQGHRLVLERLPVDGEAERRAGLVLAAIAAADGPLVVVEDVEVGFEGAVNDVGEAAFEDAEGFEAAVSVVTTNITPSRPQVTKYQIVNSAWSLAWAVSTRQARM